MAISIRLNGHSGCSIEVINELNNTVVRKISSSYDYNDRLIKQCEKQKTIEINGIKSTSVKSSGYVKGLFYFDMDYVVGTTLSEYMKTIELSEISDLVDKLLSHIVITSYDPDAKKIFMQKMDSVTEDITRKQLATEYPELKDAITQADEILSKYQWSYLNQSDCHGDYTLENLLITNAGEIFAIDFLDSFYDTWQIDVAKLLQDIELGWSYRFSGIDENLRMRLIIMKKCIMTRLESFKDGKKLIDSIYHVLLLNVLRIVPYTHDSFTMKHLLWNIKYLCNKMS